MRATRRTSPIRTGPWPAKVQLTATLSGLLVGALALAGVPAGAAVVATLAYRLVSFWLPIPAGGIAAIVHRRRYGSEAPA
jgi:hypothetical protein